MEPIENNEDLIEAEQPGESPAEEKPGARPALTINIHSWATPIVGLVALLLGLLGGFFLRPLIVPAPEAQTSGSTANPQETVSPDQAAQRQALMSQLIAQTRHFKGSPDAPVTIIEFSDFQ